MKSAAVAVCPVVALALAAASGLLPPVSRPAVLTSQEGTGRILKVVIPFDRSVNLAAASSFFKLADSNGTQFSRPGVAIPMSVPAGQRPVTVKLTVTGRK
jgi:hypothetical protein